MKACGFCGFESETPFKPAGKQQVMRLDLLADRPDLFDVGGLARRTARHAGHRKRVAEVRDEAVGRHGRRSIHRSQTKASYRPFIACAVMTLPPVDETSLIAIMKLQENLHWGVGRDRKLASIGVYDLATITAPITYRTIDPDKEPFVPLGMPGKKMTGRQILESHPKGMAYAELLADHKRYPVLVDCEGPSAVDAADHQQRGNEAEARHDAGVHRRDGHQPGGGHEVARYACVFAVRNRRHGRNGRRLSTRDGEKRIDARFEAADHRSRSRRSEALAGPAAR